METLKKRYGLWTGIAMVVGIVIGSGVFFKADDVLINTGGSLGLSLVAWGIGGLIMVVSAFCFSLMAQRFEKVNGIVDYLEVTTNKKVSYTLGWYLTTVYYPILVSILAFLSTLYFYLLCGFEGVATSWHFWLVVTLLVIGSYIFNTMAPKISGKYQVSTTIIKLIPIFLIAIIGTIIGLINGGTANGFTLPGNLPADGSLGFVTSDLSQAVLATAFAYEGWVLATSINAELKDSKKNLSKALVLGTTIVIFAYMLYYIGLSSIISNSEVLAGKNEALYQAAAKLLKSGLTVTLFKIFIVVSCLGTLNGLTMAGCRGMYSLAVRGQGPKPNTVSVLHEKYNMSIKSSVFGLVFTLFFLFVWWLGMKGPLHFITDNNGAVDSSMDELAIAVIYLSYIPMYIWIMKNLKELPWFQRYVIPSLAILGAGFLVFAATGLFTLVTTGDFQFVINFLIFSGIAALITTVGQFFFRETNMKN